MVIQKMLQENLKILLYLILLLSTMLMQLYHNHQHTKIIIYNNITYFEPTIIPINTSTNPNHKLPKTANFINLCVKKYVIIIPINDNIINT